MKRDRFIRWSDEKLYYKIIIVITINNNCYDKELLDEVEYDIMNYQNWGR